MRFGWFLIDEVSYSAQFNRVIMTKAPHFSQTNKFFCNIIMQDCLVIKFILHPTFRPDIAVWTISYSDSVFAGQNIFYGGGEISRLY